MAPEFVSLLEGVFFFIELGMYMCISNTQIRDYPTNDQKWDNKDNFISWKYTTVL